MLWHEEYLSIDGMPEDCSARLIGRFEDKKVAICLIYSCSDEVYEAELWSKTIKSTLRPLDPTVDDLIETFNDKIEKYRQKSTENRNYEFWLPYFVGHVDDINKAKKIIDGLIP